MMMRTLWAASLRHLLRHPAQFALALLGLALGVATIVSVDIATASARRALELSLDAVNGAATHEILGGPAGIDEQIYVGLRMRGLGVDLAPVVEGYVAVADRALRLLGIDPFAASRVAGREAVTDVSGNDPRGTWFTRRGAVLLAPQTARQLGIEIGKPFTIEVGGRTHSAWLLAGIAEADVGHDTLSFTDIAQAQEWLGMIGRLSRIDVRAPGGQAGIVALDKLRRVLPSGLRLRETQRRAGESADLSRAFATNLQAMSLLALLVGVFLIHSAVSFAVVQRRKIFGVLRALGATRASIVRIVLVEASLLGLVGVGIGILLGAGIGRELIELVSRTINDLYFVVTVNEVVLPGSSIGKAVLAGVGGALLAAALPAIEAAHSAPQLGLRRSVLEQRAMSVSRWLVVGSAALATAAGAVVLTTERSLLAGFIALALLLLAIAALTPAALRALARGAAGLAARYSIAMRLALGDVAASLSRTGVAVAALSMAVAAMIGVAIMVESFRESLHDWLKQTLRADLYVSAPGPGFARPERKIDRVLIDALLATPGIAAHSASRRVTLESPHGALAVDALELAAPGYPGIRLTFGSGATVWSAFERGGLVISESLAWRLNLSPADRLELATPAGWRLFPIVSIYRDYGNDRGNVLMSRRIYQRLWGDPAITSLGIYLAPNVDPAGVAETLRAAAEGVSAPHRQALLIRSNAELRALSMRIFERTFVITRVLYWLAAAVAAIALVSAFVAWELERARELAIVRSLGLTPRGAAALIESQTLFMGFVAFLIALPAGVLTALLLIHVINRRAFGWQIELHWDFAQLGQALLLALGAALVAGIYPAWRSARLPCVREMRDE